MVMSSAPRPAHPAGAAALPLELADLGELVGVGGDELIRLVERAVAESYARAHPADAGVAAQFEPQSATVSLWRHGVSGGEPEAVPLTAELTRLAVQAVRTAVTQRQREVERERVLREGIVRAGELADAIIERQDGRLWWLRVDGMPALLPPEEQVAGDRLERNHHLKVLLLDVRRRPRDAVLVVSRSHPQLLRRLLEQEVPELAEGQVVVRALAREAGRRSKVAVDCPGGALDPEGACIGPRGVRIRAVVAELGEEQVQVVRWSADPAELVARALAPAAALTVELDEESRTAHVTVPAAQLSLAIGRAGENARVAARLTGWRIDIRAAEAV